MVQVLVTKVKFDQYSTIPLRSLVIDHKPAIERYVQLLFVASDVDADIVGYHLRIALPLKCSSLVNDSYMVTVCDFQKNRLHTF